MDDLFQYAQMDMSERIAKNTKSTAKSTEATSARFRVLNQQVKLLSEQLEEGRKEFSDFKCEQEKKEKANVVLAIEEKKKDRRHEILVAAFTVALTLFLEHIGDFVQLVYHFFQ